MLEEQLHKEDPLQVFELNPDMLVILVASTEVLTPVSVELVRVFPGVDRARSCTGQCCVESSSRTWLWTAPVCCS